MSRLERLQALLVEYGQNVHDYAAGEEEDLRPYFEHKKIPCEWCCITQNGTPGSFDYKTFFLPCHDSAASAQLRATEYIDDDTFTELPVAVVNLDTGERYEALLLAEWHKAE